ncbi:MAG: cysteine hydrolase [Hyphomicrobiales bacterium]|nr:MAG: cysteine hydrolase [Hyphomicrobiales bacterium]
MTQSALILIDIQNDYFGDGRWPVEGMKRAAANAARLLARARETGQVIIHIRHEIPSDAAPFFRPGSQGAEIHGSVAPIKGEKVILKHRPNSFQGTSLHQDLQAAGITDLTLCGAMSQMCVDATTRAAVDLGYQVTVIEDACGAKEQQFNGVTVAAAQVHAAFMAPLAMSYARVIGCDDYLAEAD